MVYSGLGSWRMELMPVLSRLLRRFFISSRRRHTRCLSDWSSDVCSSDLAAGDDGEGRVPAVVRDEAAGALGGLDAVEFLVPDIYRHQRDGLLADGGVDEVRRRLAGGGPLVGDEDGRHECGPAASFVEQAARLFGSKEQAGRLFYEGDHFLVNWSALGAAANSSAVICLTTPSAITTRPPLVGTFFS